MHTFSQCFPHFSCSALLLQMGRRPPSTHLHLLLQISIEFHLKHSFFYKTADVNEPRKYNCKSVNFLIKTQIKGHLTFYLIRLSVPILLPRNTFMPTGRPAPHFGEHCFNQLLKVQCDCDVYLELSITLLLFVVE